MLAIAALFRSIFGEADRYFHLGNRRFYFILCLSFQWQCKADLENTYRFGQIEVSCEGYDYPDDPYILRGSCSLLFRLELTEEGERKVKNSGSFGSGYYQSRKDSSDSGAGAIVIIVVLVLAFGVYKLFLSNQQPQQSFDDSDGFTRPSWQSQQAPPPPGFKSSFTGRAPSYLQYSKEQAGLYCFICSRCRWDRLKTNTLAVDSAELAADPAASFAFHSLFKSENKILVSHRLSGQAVQQAALGTFETLSAHALQTYFSYSVKYKHRDREE